MLRGHVGLSASEQYYENRQSNVAAPASAFQTAGAPPHPQREFGSGVKGSLRDAAPA